MAQRVSSKLMHFDYRVRAARFLMTKILHDVFEPQGTMPESDVKDMNRSGQGFPSNEQHVRETKICKMNGL